MKLRILTSLILVLVLFAAPAFSQKFVKVKKSEYQITEDGYKDAKKNIRKGNAQYKRDKKGAYAEAIPYYLNAHEYNEDNAALNYLIGICYIKTADKDKAFEFIDNAYDINEVLTPDLLYWRGIAQQYNYDFEGAIESFEDYLATLDVKKVQKVKMEVDKHIDECKSAIALMKTPVRCFIDNLGEGINTADPEYSPVFFLEDSILYFTSRRENTTGGKKNIVNQLYFEDVYLSYAKNGKWGAAEQMGRPINSKHNDAAVDISPEGKELCIYKGYKGEGDLYNSQNSGDGWKGLIKMRKIDKGKHRESSVSVSKDSMTLFFISNRKGGQGGQDIWFSYRTQNGVKWQKPENMGAVVNSKYDEETVEVSSDGKTLFFSSRGHNTMGGYDVFKTKRNDDGTWTEPENIGYPINTPYDDVFFMLTPNERFGYYSTTRKEGYGDKDIYSIVFLGPEKPVNITKVAEKELIAYASLPVSEAEIEKPVNIVVIQLSMVKGVVTDALSGEPIGATLELVDNATGEVVKVVNSYPSTGAYTVTLPPGRDYALTAGAPDYFFHSENFVIADTSTHEVIRKDIQLQPMGIGAKIVLNNVFFDSGKAILRQESFTELNRLVTIVKQYKNLKVEISGHTDSQGSATYNQKLSQKRAQAVVDYLIGQGVNGTQIIAVGYGEVEPRADNTSAEGRQLNRRVEAKILEK